MFARARSEPYHTHSAWMNSNDAEQHAKVVALNVARTPAHHQHILVILVLLWIAFHVSAHAYR